MMTSPGDEDDKAQEAVDEVLEEQAEQEAEAVQDDSREKRLRELFGLVKPEGSGRSGDRCGTGSGRDPNPV